MRVEIVRKGKILPTIVHEGTVYAKAPKKGRYTIRLTNDSCCRRMAVVSVDGINVIDGKDAGHAGSGYVMAPREVLEIPGWRRSGKKVASFAFKEQEESYANQTGRGTTNVGVIGVAVFDEKVRPPSFYFPHPVPPAIIREEHHHWHNTHPCRGTPDITWTGTTSNTLRGSTVTCDSSGGEAPNMVFACSTRSAPTRRRKANVRCKKSWTEPTKKQAKAVDVGTAYGEETTFETRSVDFERATTTPWEVLTVRYATKARLESWGVPVSDMRAQTAPSAFPAEEASCPPPPGW